MYGDKLPENSYSLGGTLWNLSSSIRSLNIVKNGSHLLSTTVELTLLDYSGTYPQTIKKIVCEFNEPVVEDVDGYLVVTLEKIMFKAARVLFGVESSGDCFEESA